MILNATSRSIVFLGKLVFPPSGFQIGLPRYETPLYEGCVHLVTVRTAFPTNVPAFEDGVFWIVSRELQDFMPSRVDLLAPYNWFCEGGLVHCRQFAVQEALSEYGRINLWTQLDNLLHGVMTPEQDLKRYRDWRQQA